MMFAYRECDGRLERLPPGADVAPAVWIDLYRPQPEQAARVAALGVAVPTLAEMEEIELSNRLYREGDADYMTVVLPGLSTTKDAMAGPVTFVLTPARLVTVRHHAPRPFETYPERADKVGVGCNGPDRLFLSLVEEIVGRLADLLEGSGRALDALAAQVYADGATDEGGALSTAVQRIARESEQIARVRLALLTLERALGFYGQAQAARTRGEALKPAVKGLLRDITALEEHAGFLTARVAMATDATLGLINLGQARTIKIFSVLAVVFLPPTVIASAYGMNFEVMPELGWSWGYPMALGLMLASAVGTYAYFKWKKWL